MSDSPVEVPVPQVTGASRRERFYSRRDWVAGALAWAAAFAGYLWTLQPSVGLEDSGEMLTAAYNLGVPHPPGYPMWTILAWIWWHILPFGNIAWRINILSALFGAAACGVATLLVSKSGHVMCAKVGFLHAEVNQRLVDLIVMSSSICAGLLLAFAPVMWWQCLNAKGTYALNAFLLFCELLLLYRWSLEPEKRWRLYVAALLWGIGLTVHQTLVLLTVAFPAFIWLVDRKLGRDVLAPILVVIIAGVGTWIVQPGSMFHEGPFAATVLLGLAIGCAVWLYFLWKEGPGFLRQWPQALLVYGAVILGLSVYSYLFFSSCTNPPMNWGHCSQWEGFKHHFTRGQYEKVHVERSLLQLWGQLNMFFDDLQSQFNILYALLALVALFFFRDLDGRDRHWLKFLLIGFLCLGIGFIFLSNPTFEKQKQFTDRVFFLPCHCIYALWIGYGLMLGLGYLFTEKPQWLSAAIPATIIVVLLPAASIKRNWAGEEQRDHDFGYRFGYDMFKPGGGYPEMDRDAVLYGGTDPGRFVPTYMIFVESFAPPGAKSVFPKCPDSATFDRRDVYIITQNALADSTYMAYIRDHYDYSRPTLNDPKTLADRGPVYRALFSAAWNALGRSSAYPKEPIWIPAEKDSQAAFQKYVEELKTRQPMPGEDVKVENGHVSVQGVAGVMAINGYLTKDIFEHNKDTHSFYVEESYVIPWMYPYMEPFGIILKINKEPLAGLTPEMVQRDADYWDALGKDLDQDPKFHRDDVAQMAFSKLRSAIGGLYAYRHMTREAEYAFQQAIKLCPHSPEANFRLAQLYVELGRFDDSIKILENYQRRDPLNTKIGAAIDQLKEMKRGSEETSQLEQQLKAQPGNLALAMQLAGSYAARQRVDRLDYVVSQLISHSDLPQSEFLQLANFYVSLNRPDRIQAILTQFVQRYPQNPVGWYNLAVLHSARGKCDQAIPALERALTLDTPDQQVHQLARQDAKLNNCRRDPNFQRLLAQPETAGSPTGLPFNIIH